MVLQKLTCSTVAVVRKAQQLRIISTSALKWQKAAKLQAENVVLNSTIPEHQAPYKPFSREGDDGTSRILTGKSYRKDHKVFAAIGTAEELLSSIGLAREHACEAGHDYVLDKLKRIQTVIIDLSTAISRYGDSAPQRLDSSYTRELEDWIEEYSRQLPPPELYIIPGGGVASASLHLARAICRRMERVIVPLAEDGALDCEILHYANRLSDFLFVASRMAAKTDKRTESIYIPRPDQTIQAQ